MRGEISERLFRFLSENPNASNTQIAEACGTNSNAIRTFLYRYKTRGLLDIRGYGENRSITVLKPDEDEQYDVKRDTYLLMLAKYSELFENSNNLDECVAVGKNILRILEKL